MKLRSPWLIRCVAFVASLLVRLWMMTVRMKKTSFDRIDHPADPAQESFLYCFWHEGLLGPMKIRTAISILISQHADGELIAQICEHLGFGTVRGSTTRGGCEALLCMIRGGSQNSHLAITPDGPRGPRRKFQPGAILVASESGLAIMPIGIGFTSAWRFRSWDRFALPKPFSTVVGVIGERIEIPPRLDRSGIATWQAKVEEALLAAQDAADCWAEQLSRDSKAAAPVSRREQPPLRDVA